MTVGFFDLECTGLDANFHQIICGCIHEFQAGNNVDVFRCDDYKSYKKEPWDDSQLVYNFTEALRKYDVIVSWYGKGFDLKFLNTRLLHNGLPAFLSMKHIDLYFQARHKLKLHSNRLEVVAQFLETEHKPTKLVPYVWSRATRGGQKAALDYIVNHCCLDVLVLGEVYDRLKHMIKCISA